ncbi:unnamed protein product [Peronospora belbahrii]|uniref:DNA-directed RNA polymerase n=1 Tax=Peronospora belbahrii TaxID=622444 RepID=A0AAU9KYL8_9STRA|nr:unnamed protein product [Peronospora belbahrii]
MTCIADTEKIPIKTGLVTSDKITATRKKPCTALSETCKVNLPRPDGQTFHHDDVEPRHSIHSQGEGMGSRSKVRGRDFAAGDHVPIVNPQPIVRMEAQWSPFFHTALKLHQPNTGN